MEQLIASSDTTVIARLCKVLEDLLVPDTNVIEKATSELRNLNKHSAFVPSLFSVLCRGDDAEIRKLAAIIFRRKVSRQWKSFNRAICNGVRQAVLERLLVEREMKVSQSLCQVAASIAKHELTQPNGSWPDLFEVIKQGVKDAQSKEVAVYLLSVVCDSVNESLEPQFIDLLTLIGGTLEDLGNNVGNTEIYAVKAFDSLVPYLGDEYVNLVRPLVLKCVRVIQRLLETDEERAAEIMEVFETLIETEVAFISPYVKDLVLFALEIASKSDFEDATRVRALSVLRWIIKLKKKAVIKLGLVGAVVDSVIPIITSQTEEDEGISFSSDEVESEVPVSSATYIIDELALHLPPERLYKVMMPKIEQLVASNDPSHRHGLVLILGCLAEGTAEYIKNNYLKSFLEIICRSSLDENHSVRYASLFAIGQFSEHLQPDISKFAPEVMPLLFQILQTTPETNKGITRAYYGLENFVESLDKDILPYLDQLMTHLLTTLQNCEKIHTRELVVSTIGAVANAAKESILPYLGQILSQLRVCLPTVNQQNGENLTQQNEDSENLSLLHMQTLDTLGVLARTVGKKNFLPLAEDCLKLGMDLIENEDDDPDMRRAAYGLFSAIATVVEEKMSPFLSVIIKHMLESVNSTEGVVAHYSEETNGGASSKDFSFLDDGETDLTAEVDCQDDDEDFEGFSVGNSYMEEKSDACEAIGELAKHTKNEFAPYLEAAFEKIFVLVEFPHSDVRKAAIASCGELTMCSYKLKHQTFSNFLSQIFPVICKTIVKNTERLVVMGAIATANQMAECCGMDCFCKGEESLKELMEALLLVVNEKSACQDADDDGEDEQQEHLQAEHDEMLIEYCGEIMPVLAKSLGAATFLQYFIGFLPTLLAKTKPSSTTSERSFSSGTIAETFQKLGPGSTKEVVAHILPRFLELTRDKEIEVRNNVIFGIGVILQNADSAAIQFYPTALSTLSQVLTVEKSRQVIDNILGAVSRLILANKDAVPMQVVPVLLSHLPIQDDHEEDGVVYSCLSRLLHDDLEITVKIQIIKIFIKVVQMEEVEQEIRSSISEELKSMHQRDASIIAQACETTEPELVARLQTILLI